MPAESEGAMKYYRYEEMYFGDGTARIYLVEFDVARETRCGVWIRTSIGDERFVINGRKRYAWPTIEEARRSYLCRRRKQVDILERQLVRAKACLAAARKGEWVERLFNVEGTGWSYED